MKVSISLLLVASMVCLLPGNTCAQSDWEFLGPEVGYRHDAFFISQNAVYLGLAEEDPLTGLGLYRYRFEEGEWQLFAWEGSHILGVTVWGESDENILLIQIESGGSFFYVRRSTDGGDTWSATHSSVYGFSGLSQAPSDSSRVLIHSPTIYSTDGGWSWYESDGYVPWGNISDAVFDPSNALIAYLTGVSPFGDRLIHKSTDGGAYWHESCICAGYGLDVDRSATNNVMAGTIGNEVRVTTDAGENWSTKPAPFKTKMVHSPPWSPGSFYVEGSDLDETTYEVWRTEDFGETWFSCGDNLPNMAETSLGSTRMYLEGHPTEPVLYVALDGSGVWRWDVAASGVPTATEGSDPDIRLLAYPTPTSDRFTYGLRLSRSEHVLLRLFDARGRLAQTLLDEFSPPGTHVFGWDDDGEQRPPSRIYYLRLDAGGVQVSKKVAVLK